MAGLSALCGVDAEDFCEAEVLPALALFVVHAGLKGGEERTALGHIVAELPALFVAEQRDVGQDER